MKIEETLLGELEVALQGEITCSDLKNISLSLKSLGGHVNQEKACDVAEIIIKKAETLVKRMKKSKDVSDISMAVKNANIVLGYKVEEAEEDVDIQGIIEEINA